MLVRIIAFYVLTLLFTVLLGGVQQVAGLSTAIVAPQWGPALAALVMLVFFRKDQLRVVVFDRKVPLLRYLLAALIPVLGAALVYLMYRPFAPPSSGTMTATPWILMAWFPFGAIGEEIGWRGYLHKRLNAGSAGVASSLIVGMLWGFWHVGMYQNGIPYMIFFVLLMVSYTFVMYALMVDAEFNVLVASIFHMMINVAGLLSYSSVNKLGFMIVDSCVWAGLALLVVLTRKSVFMAARSARGEVLP